MTTLKQMARRVVGPLGLVAEGFRSGHVRSGLAGRSVDAHGGELPWYTAPAIEALAQIDFSGKSVLEFGGGQSTIWWARRAAHVMSLESNRAWLARMENRIGELGLGPKVELVHVDAPQTDLLAGESERFDVIVIDDGSGIGPHGRVENFHIGMRLAKRDTLLVIDNTEADYMAPVLADPALQSNLALHLWGLAPGSFRKSCTTLLFLGRDPA